MSLNDYEEARALLDKIRADEQLSEEDFVRKCLDDIMGGWVPMAQYLKMFPSETANAIHKRVHQGAWKRQVHYAAPEGGLAWVNLKAVRLWLEGRLE